MTEKQFTDIEVGADTGRVRLYNGINFMEYSSSELLDLLNEQHETITRLKKDIDSFSHNWALMYNEAKNKVEELSKENKQLKHELKLLAEFNQKATL